ncbi:carbonic anhydrase [Alteribacillus persepolensis]|uniref:carbonic anhydrase n=1 Tax=Alteribacillus persepolensis TaxID=568899 RepID=A0A1G8EF64_9BACI|nr:carbonic anhydrase family protein [Alteribacillus persepolensis]SDH68563.1 carbonic anhydrase [Alteribacillus persepolensis]
MQQMSYKLIGSCLAASLSFFAAGCQESTKETNAPNEEERLGEEQEWSYGGETGPEHWGNLDPAYADCVNGNEQSPVNIEFSQVAEGEDNAGNMEINYQPAVFTFVHNGHTIQAENPSEVNRLTIDEKEYELAQFHFHTPSEHEFNGEKYEMELHLVHEGENGQLAVLGVMLQEGEENEELSKAWENLPETEREEDITVDDPIDVQALLPENQESFYYDGSLTTPPCTEEVKWSIFEQPMEMSKEQIEDFQRIFPDNHRPVQEQNDRGIMKSLN